MTTRQLRVSGKAAKGLRQNLKDGVFSVIFEYALPSTEKPFMMAVEDGVELAKYVAKEKRISSLAITEGLDSRENYSLLEVVQALKKVRRRSELIAGLSDRRLPSLDIPTLLTDLASANVTSVVVHSGAALPDHPMDDKGRPRTQADQYMDSCRLLHLIRRTWGDLFLGARINPFKYNVADSHLQYFRMMKCIATGADFITTQAGWDMKKIHELQWYQQRRNIDQPIIARFLYTHTEDVTHIIDGKYPGFVISRELGTRIQREYKVEAEGAQKAVRRLALQVAGCRLLGCSGAQIAGISETASATAVIDDVFAALNEFEDYSEWLEAWKEFNGEVEMAPTPNRYYVFKNLLDHEHLDYEDKISIPTPDMIEDPTAGERWRYNLALKLGLEQRNGPIGKLLQRLICDYRPGKDWHIEKTALMCAGNCPKGLEEGPCEQTFADGTCEFGHQTCFYHSVLRLEQWQRNLQVFEEPYGDQ